MRGGESIDRSRGCAIHGPTAAVQATSLKMRRTGTEFQQYNIISRRRRAAIVPVALVRNLTAIDNNMGLAPSKTQVAPSPTGDDSKRGNQQRLDEPLTGCAPDTPNPDAEQQAGVIFSQAAIVDDGSAPMQQQLRAVDASNRQASNIKQLQQMQAELQEQMNKVRPICPCALCPCAMCHVSMRHASMCHTGVPVATSLSDDEPCCGGWWCSCHLVPRQRGGLRLPRH